MAIVALAVSPAVASAQAPPAPPLCPAGTEPADTFDQLPHRVAYGIEISYTNESDADVGLVSGPITLIVHNRLGAVIDEIDDGAELDNWTLTLPFGTRFRDVSMSYTQTAPDANPGSACLMIVEQRVSGYSDIRMPASCTDPSSRPTWITIACGDGNFGLHHLHWHGWGGGTATATADAYANDCDPYCAAGHFSDSPVRLTVSRPRQLSSDDPYIYTRMTITYGGRSARQLKLRAKLDDEGGYYWSPVG